MGDLATIAKLTASQIAVLLGLFLPGFVSIKIDRMIHPGEELKAPELVVDAFGYSILNLGVLAWPAFLLFREVGAAHPQGWLITATALVVFVAGPSIWPLIVRGFQRFASRRGWVLSPYKFAFDTFFARKEACWVVVHLPDGTLVGGYMGDRSAASMAPQTGHLYIEELWQLGETGEFIAALPRSKGALFRPNDYHWVELFADKENADEE